MLLGKSQNLNQDYFESIYFIKIHYLKLSSIINNRNLHACNCNPLHLKVGKDEFKHDAQEYKNNNPALSTKSRPHLLALVLPPKAERSPTDVF
jgi:hypothetical protein